ncbi:MULTISPECIES: hypothetical protein [unclassified Acidiphilium]|uniref:hypothetical protein n=1 Tax=unclassified Acidiphilium TaxID=2617493 RepID=UPI000BD40019|nr:MULTISPECIES: hypothetical protein [unclassified Acidiphilium]OYV54512.1 MAG: hypothetical protein B7Z76_14145 [Acidiphilium sp. 20-67-58]HQT62539.1 hypothetical protein [Acidiphilium sp.]
MATRKARRADGGRITEDRDWDARNGRDADDSAPTDVYAGRDSGVASEAKGNMVKRKSGGKVQGYKDRLDETKNPKKRREMEAGHRVNEELDKTRGDRMANKKDERRKRKSGGRVEHMEGSAAKKRLDRPGRKRGGGVGSDSSPLTTASRTTDRKGGPADEAMITGGGD